MMGKLTDSESHNPRNVERLAERNGDGGISVADLPAALKKLAEYEDAEQDGRLTLLPVKPGQVLYRVRFSEFHCCHYVAEWTVIDVHLRKERTTIYFREGNGLSDAFWCDYGDSTWRDMYMTRTEAEVALRKKASVME